MILRDTLRSENFAVAVGAVVALFLALVAFLYVGWLGIGLIGIFGLLVSTRIDMHDGYAIADGFEGSNPVHMLAKQIKETESNSSPEKDKARQQEKHRRSKLFYLINTVFFVMSFLGIGLFFLHQI